MRFLSKYGGLTISAIPAEEQPMPNGKLAVLDRGVTCKFRSSLLSEYEYELALREFKFNGLPMEMDGHTPISPRRRIGVYDTDVEAEKQHWNAETKEIVERALLEKARNSNMEVVQKAIVERNAFRDSGHPRDRKEGNSVFVPSFEKFLIYVEPKQITKPWRTYDEITTAPGRGKADVARKIIEVANEIGVEPQDVLEYERANANRPEVVEALEAELPEVTVTEEEIAVTT